MKMRMLLGAGVAGLLAASANAGPFQWDWHVGDPGDYEINNGGGKYESVHSEYDPASKHFTWSVTFSDQVTKGFTLAVNNGPNPKAHPGQLALLYVDATNKADIRLTAYGYNGRNDGTTWTDGNGAVAGNQTPDLILDHNDPGWVLSTSAVDAAGKRTISFTIDATAINAHNPLYPDPDNDPWLGVQFDQKLGLWMHTYKQFNATYYSSGKIKSFAPSYEGWFDGQNFQTVPAPGAVAMLGVGFTAVGSRRRRAR